MRVLDDEIVNKGMEERFIMEIEKMRNRMESENRGRKKSKREKEEE